MRTSSFKFSARNGPVIFSAALVIIVTGCGKPAAVSLASPETKAASVPTASTLDPLARALTQHDGDAEVDKEIRGLQEQVRSGRNRAAALERLGWAFVAKARASFDPGFYKLAEACANVLESDSPDCGAGRLLRGHVFQNLHRFKEAEEIARKLVIERGLPFDYALLGDTLMEQGQLTPAAEAYQEMVNLRPGFEAYSRIAHLRWLTGDLDGAMAMMQTAIKSTSSADADTAAWANSQLAKLQLQSGDATAAQQTCEAALTLRPNYPPALLLRGKLLLGQNDAEAAVADLQSAAKANPLPEYQWALAEALRADGREDEAAQIEAQITRHGEATDPRTLSLYLATRAVATGSLPAATRANRAVQLAQSELAQREDVFTHDALAWALTSAGRVAEARPHLARALAAGTEDARLFFHAAVIASRAGRVEESQRWFTRAVALTGSLLPSERAQLLELPESFTTAQTGTDANNSSTTGL